MAILVALMGCGDDVAAPNLPPDTTITATPPDLDATGSQVTFAWAGSDPDGAVATFEWRLSDNGTDGAIDPPETLALAWTATAEPGATIHVTAALDSFPVDVLNPGLPPAQIRYWQTHTLFVRAVDGQGARDPTPATVSFTATTLAPTVEIKTGAGIVGNNCTLVSTAVNFRWTAIDPDGDGGLEGPPYASRTLWWELPDCLSVVQFERDNPIAAAPAEAWSPWVAYDAAGEAGRTRAVGPLPIGGIYLFAVQVMDMAGAVSPVFTWNHNVRHVQAAREMTPRLIVSASSLGNFEFTGQPQLITRQLLEGQDVSFQFEASAHAYLGSIAAYRYGFDVADVSDPNDPGWAVDWGNDATHRRVGPHAFAAGSRNFVVMARDAAGGMVRGHFLFDVVDAPPRSQQRELLLVKDWPHGGTASELALHRSWDEQWRSLLVNVIEQYDPVTDVVDVFDSPGGPSLNKLVGYRSVLWFIKGSDPRTVFHANLAPTGFGDPPFNWLEEYQRHLGNVLFVGPAAMLATFEWRSNLTFPAVFASPCNAEMFGPDVQLPGGSTVPAGTQRYPYTAFCLEATDLARPPTGQLYGERPGALAQLRSRDCDGLARALVDDEFLARHPSAQGLVVPLEPGTARQQIAANDGQYLFRFEEFYNVNLTQCPAQLTLRECQQTMFRWSAQRDEGFVVRPDTLCVPRGRTASSLAGVPVGVASTVYSSTKPVPGSADFLWGFHPLGFQPDGVRAALDWIARESWQLDAR